MDPDRKWNTFAHFVYLFRSLLAARFCYTDLGFAVLVICGFDRLDVAGWLAQEIELIHLTRARLNLLTFYQYASEYDCMVFDCFVWIALSRDHYSSFCKAIESSPLLGWLNHFAGMYWEWEKPVSLGIFCWFFSICLYLRKRSTSSAIDLGRWLLLGRLP